MTESGVDTGGAPKVSVLCVAYNHARFIEQTLESILSQDLGEPFEVLVHDDASTDGTADRIRPFLDDPRATVRAIFSTPNQYSQGVPIIKRILLPLVRGEYVALCEGDDYWTDPRKLRRQVTFMDAHPDVSVCYHRAGRVDEHGTPSGAVDDGAVRICDGIDALGFSPPTASTFFRTRGFDASRLLERTPHGDAVMRAYLATIGRVADLGFVGSAYRVHSGGMYSGRSLRARFLNSVRTRRAILASDLLPPEFRIAMERMIHKKKRKYVAKLIRKGDIVGGLQVLRS